MACVLRWLKNSDECLLKHVWDVFVLQVTSELENQVDTLVLIPRVSGCSVAADVTADPDTICQSWNEALLVLSKRGLAAAVCDVPRPDVRQEDKNCVHDSTQFCHQTYFLCGSTTFGTKLNQVPNQYGPYAHCSLDKTVAKTSGGGGVWHVRVDQSTKHSPQLRNKREKHSCVLPNKCNHQSNPFHEEASPCTLSRPKYLHGLHHFWHSSSLVLSVGGLLICGRFCVIVRLVQTQNAEHTTPNNTQLQNAKAYE